MLAVMCKFSDCYDKVFKTFIAGIFLWKYSLIQTDIHMGNCIAYRQKYLNA